MSKDKAVPCGLYLATAGIPGRLDAGTVVFYHNHGDLGPGVYTIDRYEGNRAVFSDRGVPLPYSGYERTLRALLPEGLYLVRETFSCCARQCQVFEKGTLVQLGYRRDGTPLLFSVVWQADGPGTSELGTRIVKSALALLEPVKLLEPSEVARNAFKASQRGGKA